jgi:beta-lactamase superfamily II metal-dependent hydrolase
VSLAEGKTEIIYAKPRQEYAFGEITITTMLSESEGIDLNNASIVTRLDFLTSSFLITGDAEEQTEALLVQEYHIR